MNKNKWRNNKSIIRKQKEGIAAIDERQGGEDTCKEFKLNYYKSQRKY